MIRPARVVSCALLGLFGALLAQACAASASKDPGGGTGAVMGDAGPDLGDGAQELQPNGEGGAAGASPYNPLCGVNVESDCVPDDESACESYVPPGGEGGAASGASGEAGQRASEGGDAGTLGRAGGEGGHAGDLASGGATPIDVAAGGAPAAGDGGQSGQDGDGGRSGQGGVADGPGPVGAGGAEGGDAGQAGSPGSQAGRAGEAGATVMTDGGASGQPPIAGNGGMSGGAGEPGTGPTREYACRVVAVRDGVQAQCERAGQGKVAAPCFTSADCAPGLACTGDIGAGQCRRFCCSGDGECQRGTHCAERPLLGIVTTPIVPVCVPAVDCSLTEPYPCPSGAKCSCPEGEACMVVRNDGTTTCMRPGSGIVGEACPCASGHLCSQATNQCVKLCQTAAMPSECGTGRCQASAELPAGFGVCVGVTQPAAN